MRPPRSISVLCIGLQLAVVCGVPSAHAASTLPQSPSQLLLVGDSVTAGVYFLSLSDVSIRQGWAGQLAHRLGFAPSWNRFPDFYPVNHLGLTRLGFSVGGLAYPWEAIPALFPKRPRFAADEERVILAIPGQMAHELLAQSSKNKGNRSGGWTFANLILPQGLSAIETAEQWSKRPSWVVLFIGANDLLASLGIIGKAKPPSAEAFARTYEELVARLRGVVPPGTAPEQLIVLTLPDVTGLPLLQPIPADADDGKGNRYPDGSKVFAFLAPFRSHFEPGEVWDPDELAGIQRRVAEYNHAIRSIAAENGATVVDMMALFDRLSLDPAFASPDSPYFSPDLHHPSYRTHSAIAETVLDAMVRVSGAPLPPPVVRTESPLPHNGDFSKKERARANAMVHLGLQGLRAGPLPPAPTFRLAAEAGVRVNRNARDRGAVSVIIGMESTATPVSPRWLSRGSLQVRVSPVAFDGVESGDVEGFPKSSLDARAGVAFERIGMWHWTRIGAGALYAAEGGFGWYTRGEWRVLFAEVSSRDWEPDRFEAGIRWGFLFGRPGRNGN